MAKLKLFTLSVPVVHAVGFQVYEIKALDAEDAIQRFKDGGGEYVDEEIEVQSVGEPEII